MTMTWQNNTFYDYYPTSRLFNIEGEFGFHIGIDLWYN